MRRTIYAALRAVGALDRRLRERLTIAGWLVLATAGTAAAAGLDTNLTVTYRAFAFLAALLGMSWIASLVFRARFEARRDMPRYATAGEPFSYRVTIVNRGARTLAGALVTERFRDPRPTFEEWKRAREPGEEQRNWFDRNVGYFRWRWLIDRRVPRDLAPAALAPLAPGERQSVKLGFTPRRRGRIEFSGLTLGRTDPLGLVKGLARVPLEARLIALPKRYRLPEIALPGRRKFQPGGVSLAVSVGDSEEFLALRDYRPGDPLHRMHWKSFARTGKPVVKEYQDEFFERHALVLDTGSAQGEDAAFEEAVALAASFVYTIDTQDCLLDLLFVGGEVRAYTAGRGQMHAEHMLEALAGVAPSAPDDFEALARAVLGRRATLSSVIAIFVHWDAERARLVSALRAEGFDVRALLVRETGDAPPGVLQLRPGKIEQGLAQLR
ncbi:MAG TPA: DUF58 domain-containing protein [Burkholderiales bacterium]|nr:DUF58 domain-containing protein [Burkholderiales bacterium]